MATEKNEGQQSLYFDKRTLQTIQKHIDKDDSSMNSVSAVCRRLIQIGDKHYQPHSATIQK